MDDHLWTDVECAEFLRFSENKLRRLMRDRKIPYSRIDGSIRFLPERTRESDWYRAPIGIVP